MSPKTCSFVLFWSLLSGILLGWATCCPTESHAQEIGFLETFALAEDREKALEELIPGTETFYFYHCLHNQQTQKLDKVDELLKLWIKRLGYSQQVNQIRLRQALLKYSDDPATTLSYLKELLSLNLNHQRQIPQTQRDLPTTLDPQTLATKTLVASALSRYQNVGGLTDAGLKHLAGRRLNKVQRRDLLKRLVYPDYPNLVDLIVKDLKQKDSRGFGKLAIHKALTKEQLDELARGYPQVTNQTDFVNVYLTKLRPSDDVNWRADPEAHVQYLDRLWKYVKDLKPVHNSLKACVLFHKLDFDRSQGRHDLSLFKTYLQLPRQVFYVHPRITKELASRSFIANLKVDFQKHIRLVPVRNDEPLVRHYLHHFLRDARNSKTFATLIDSNYLNRQFATVKILSGQGESEHWASMLSPTDYQQLVSRVDLDFVPDNPKNFAVDDDVKLKLNLKNVKQLIVKVFEINAFNYYREHGTEIDTDINLDGLVPNHEQTFDYDDAPARRIERSFEFPQIDKRGVFVVDFIAGGKNSRALVRKGRLQMTSQVTAAGQRFSILDELGQVATDANLWVAGKRYSPDDDGRILIPFSTQPGQAQAIISQGNFSCLQSFDRLAEKYQFSAGIVIDRESLTQGNKARILLRPSLRIHKGDLIPVSLLQNPKLTITSVNQDGIRSSKILPTLKLSESEETVCEFVVPPRLASLNVQLAAEIENISAGKTESVKVGRSFEINQIDKTESIQDLHLVPSASGYLLEVLGKTGELRAKQSVRVLVSVTGFKDPVEANLQSNENGLIELGSLENVDSIEATLLGGSSKKWSLLTSNQTHPQTINSIAGESVRIATASNLAAADRANFSLLEQRGNTFVADHGDAIEIKEGQLSIKALPPGNYLLRMHTDSSRPSNITLQVTDGEPAANVLFGKHRLLENRTRVPLEIVSLGSDKKQLTIQLAGAHKMTRVHVVASRYQPAFSAWDALSSIRDVEPWSYRPARRESAYIEGRRIGDEYQYILQRKYAKRFPGNMLRRPSLLLNPWSTKQTENGSQAAAGGSDFSRSGNESDGKADRKASEAAPKTTNADFANLDYLGSGGDLESRLLANLRCDEQGKVVIDTKDLGMANHIRVIAVDPWQVSQRTLDRRLQKLEPRDGRLAAALDPDSHFTQRKQIQVLDEGETLTIKDITSARFQHYDDLASVYRLLTTVNPDANAKKFEFILTWLDKTADEKRELYSKHACHELNFFLYKKDPPFFKDVVATHLQNKLHKTFLDHWLLEAPLESYAEPWNYSRLNVVERILLAQRLPKRRLDIVRNIDELYALNPAGQAVSSALYDSAMLGFSLNGRFDDSLKRDAYSFQIPQRSVLPDLKKQRKSRIGGGIGGAAGNEELDEMDMDGLIVAGKKSSNSPSVVPGDGLTTLSGGMKPKTRLRLESRTRQVPVQKMRREKRFKTLDDGTQQEYEISVPYTENVTQNYSVQVPYSKSQFDFEQREELIRQRDRGRNLYRRPDATREWIENNYYQLLPEQQSAQLVSTNRFWRDYANHSGDVFVSPWFTEANRNFTEIMFALSVLDLPLKGTDSELKQDEIQVTFVAGGPTIVFHQQVTEAAVADGNTSILISENTFARKDRYRFEEGVRYDKFVSDSFHTHTLYGTQVVITNPTSTPQNIELLMQIPQGSVTSFKTPATQTLPLTLDAFSTKTFEYSFYFPTAGDFSHYPAHVSADEKVLAVAKPVSFVVTDQPVEVDKTSWQYISQNGSPDQLIEFLNTKNILRLDLAKIAFRMQDKAFFNQVLEVLRKRCVYNHVLWSYAVKHDDQEALSEFLTHDDSVTGLCRPFFESDLLSLQPVKRNWYQHREYWPLLNARAHKLGSRRKILNPSFFSQYQQLLVTLSFRETLRDEDYLAITCYMLLQDRIESAIQHFQQVDGAAMATDVQYAYCDAYLEMYLENPNAAATKAKKWVDYPVDHWRNRFKNIISQVDEVRSGKLVTTDPEDVTQQQTEQASKAGSFDFETDSETITLSYRNLAEVQVNFYEMDIEMLFSRSPFAQDNLEGFSMTRPNVSKTVTLKSDQKDTDSRSRTKELNLPDELKNKNVLVEVAALDQTKSKPHFANSLDLQMMENHGQLQVAHKTSRKPLPKTYVKVYAKMQDGSVRFHKDGYTDLRGRFDYVSQSNQSPDGIGKLSVLVLSDENGAVIRQVDPPAE